MRTYTQMSSFCRAYFCHIIITLTEITMKQVCNPKLAMTPPMGWNSWDCFGLDVNEAEIKENAKYMATQLKENG